MAIIRHEEAADFDAVRELNRLAFGQDAEARLVDLLHESGDAVASLVAVDETSGAAIGHILFSWIQIETRTGPVEAASLAPGALSGVTGEVRYPGPFRCVGA